MRAWPVNFSGKRRGVGLALMVIAVVIFAFGAYQLRSWNWDTATGTVGACELATTGHGSKTRYTQTCAVNWTAAGVEHQGTIAFNGRTDPTGTAPKLLVHGDDVIAYGGRIYGLLVAIFGVVLFGAALLLRRRPKDQ